MTVTLTAVTAARAELALQNHRAGRHRHETPGCGGPRRRLWNKPLPRSESCHRRVRSAGERCLSTEGIASCGSASLLPALGSDKQKSAATRTPAQNIAGCPGASTRDGQPSCRDETSSTAGRKGSLDTGSVSWDSKRDTEGQTGSPAATRGSVLLLLLPSPCKRPVV